MQEWYLGYVIRELAWGTVTPQTALFSLDFSFSREFQNINIDTVFPRIIAEGDYFLSHPNWTIIRGRWLFQMLLTGIRALNILFYYPITSKNDHIK